MGGAHANVNDLFCPGWRWCIHWVNQFTIRNKKSKSNKNEWEITKIVFFGVQQNWYLRHFETISLMFQPIAFLTFLRAIKILASFTNNIRLFATFDTFSWASTKKKKCLFHFKFNGVGKCILCATNIRTYPLERPGGSSTLLFSLLDIWLTGLLVDCIFGWISSSAICNLFVKIRKKKQIEFQFSMENCNYRNFRSSFFSVLDTYGTSVFSDWFCDSMTGDSPVEAIASCTDVWLVCWSLDDWADVSSGYTVN